MKKLNVIAVDLDDAADIADVETLANGYRRAYNRIELPNPLPHLTKSLGQPITAEQLRRAGTVFREARRVYQRYADRDTSSQFVPIDEAKAIVAAIDDAAGVIDRWKGLI